MDPNQQPVQPSPAPEPAPEATPAPAPVPTPAPGVVSPQPAPQQFGPQPQYQYPQQPQAAASPDGDYPGKTLGIIGLIVGFLVTPLIGFILCLIANNQSKKAGVKNQLAVVGVWIHGILTVLAILFIILIVILAMAAPSTQGSV